METLALILSVIAFAAVLVLAFYVFRIYRAFYNIAATCLRMEEDAKKAEMVSKIGAVLMLAAVVVDYIAYKKRR